jgi:leucine dehydrogenase
MMLKKRGITYAPDFLINAGGLINVYSEIAKYDRQESLKRTEMIRQTAYEVLEKSAQEDITPHQAALRKAEERIARVRLASMA